MRQGPELLLPDSLCTPTSMAIEQHKLRQKIYGEVRSIFKKEKGKLKDIIHKDYGMPELILENPTTERQFAKRDRGMFRNIKHQLHGEPFLCIAGRYHLEYTWNQVYPSLIKLLVKSNENNTGKIVVFDEVRNGRYRVQKLFAHEGEPGEYAYGSQLCICRLLHVSPQKRL